MPHEERLWTTAGLPREAVLPRWNDILNEAVFELTVSSSSASDFQAQLHQWCLGPFSMSVIHVHQQVVRRSLEDIRRSRLSHYEVVYVRKGHASLDHYGRETSLAEGDAVIVDSNEPYSLCTSSNSENVVLHLPQPWLRTLTPDPHAGVAKRIDHSGAGTKMLLSTLRAAAWSFEEGQPVSDKLLVEQIGGALALGLEPNRDSRTGYTRKLMLRIHGSLRDMAADPDLNAVMLAREHHISTRYLHSLFAAAGTTYGSELLRIRLNQAAQLLKDCPSLSVIDVAGQSGFSNPSHFARRFRGVYGLSPTDFRRNS